MSEDHLFELFMDGTIVRYQMVGSTYTLGAGRDLDYAVLVPTDHYKTQQPAWLKGRWVREGAEHYEGDTFVSFRQDDLNIIVMHDPEFYAKYLTAMEVCKALRLQTRRERVIVCRIVRDGMPAKEATSIDIPGEQE